MGNMAKVSHSRKGKSQSNFPLRATFLGDILFAQAFVSRLVLRLGSPASPQGGFELGRFGTRPAQTHSHWRVDPVLEGVDRVDRSPFPLRDPYASSSNEHSQSRSEAFASPFTHQKERSDFRRWPSSTSYVRRLQGRGTAQEDDQSSGPNRRSSQEWLYCGEPTCGHRRHQASPFHGPAPLRWRVSGRKPDQGWRKR